MENSVKELELEGTVLTYSFDKDKGKYQFEYNSDSYVFQMLNWGQKNILLEECIAFSQEQAKFDVNGMLFNERLLLYSLKKAIIAGKEWTIDASFLHNLNARLGDMLLSISYWINNLHENLPITDEEITVTNKIGHDGSTIITCNEYSFALKPWTWGVKNHILNNCTRVDRKTGITRINTQQFNEYMLLATLQQIKYKGEEIAISMEFLQQLKAQIGDILLIHAQEINELTATEKKKIKHAITNNELSHDLQVYCLCKEFGWTPDQVSKQNAKDIDKMVLIITEHEKKHVRNIHPSTDNSDVNTILIEDE